MDDSFDSDLFGRLLARCIEEGLSPEQAALPGHPQLLEPLREAVRDYRAADVALVVHCS